MKRFSLILALVLTTSIIFAMPAIETPTGLYQATDANGRTVSLTSAPEKILVAAKAALMPAHALFLFPEAQRAEIGLSKTDQGLGDFFPLVWPKITVGGRVDQNASVEELMTKNSDLILLKATHFESLGKGLDQVGVPNFTMSLETWDEWKAELPQLGKLLGNEARANEILGLYEDRMKIIEERVSSLADDQKPTVLLLQGTLTDNTYSFKIAPDSWLQTWMVDLVGAKPVWKGSNKAANGWSTVSFEQIAAWNPEYIVTISYNSPSSEYRDAIYASSLYSDLTAVKNHAVLASPADLMNYIQPVASWVLGAQWLAKTLHPELFSDLDIEAQVRSFYHDFYSITDSAVLDELVGYYHASVESN